MNDQERAIVARMVGEYFDKVVTGTGPSKQSLLRNKGLNSEQKNLLKERLGQIDTCAKLLSPKKAGKKWLPKTPKADNLIVEQIKAAVKQFGAYSFDDKGPHEVMFVQELVQKLNKMPIVNLIMLLEDTVDWDSKTNQRGLRAVEAILGEMQAESHFDELMNRPKLEKAFNGEL